jgi:acyl-CoA dehydrogenase
VLPIWEGTTNVLSLDVLRAEGREGAFSAVLADLSQRADALARPLDRLAVTAVREGVRGLALAARQALAGGGAALEASARKLALRTGHLAEALYLAETAAVDEVAAEQFTRFVGLALPPTHSPTR